MLAWAKVAAAPVLEALAEAEVDEARVDVRELDVVLADELLLLCEELRVGEKMVVLRFIGEPVPTLGTRRVVLAGDVGGEVWMDAMAVKFVNEEL